MSAPLLSEAACQRAVFEHLRVRAAPGTVAFAVPNGGYRRPVEAKILKGQGVLAGLPDVIAIKDARAYGLELKTEHGRLSASQRATHAALRAAGVEVATATRRSHSSKLGACSEGSGNDR